MSSHHFVREFQEPAVYFHSFGNAHMDQIGPLLEWAPYVMAHERCLRPLEEAYVKVDAILLLEGSASVHPYFAKESVNTHQIGKEEELEGLLLRLLPEESVGLHLVDTMEYLHPSLLKQWPAGFALLYHATHRFMKVKASGYSKWWPQGSLLKVLLMEPDTNSIQEEHEIITQKDGIWEWPYHAERLSCIGEPY